MTATLTEAPAPVIEHTFQPIVTVTRCEDGTYAVEFDWSDAYIGGADWKDPDAHEHDTEAPGSDDACRAVDAYARTLPASVTIPAAPPREPCTRLAHDTCPACGADALVTDTRGAAPYSYCNSCKVEAAPCPNGATIIVANATGAATVCPSHAVRAASLLRLSGPVSYTYLP